MSNYDHEEFLEWVRETEIEDDDYAEYADFEGFEDEWDEGEDEEIICHRCYGTGLVIVLGQETDCVDCEGNGTVLI